MATTPPDPSVTLANFVDMSAILTGVAADKLNPPLDPYKSAKNNLAYATAHGGAQFVGLMQYYAANASNPDVGAMIIGNSDPAISYMAKTVMLMWYLAAWYQPGDLRAYHDDPKAQSPRFVMISADAYTQSWVWRVGQTHPMGYSDWRFGYWHTPPQPLSDFIGA
jgi:hypothetical protein